VSECVCVLLLDSPIPLVWRGGLEHDGVGGAAALSDAEADDAGRGVCEGDAGPE
jgi:hypothetical protein